MTRLALFAAAAAASGLAALPARADTNADVNAIYLRIAEGIRTGDPDMSRKAYAPEAAYLAPSAGPIDQGERFHTLMRASSARLKADAVTMTIDYRLAGRTVASDTVIDMGYYRTAMQRPSDAQPQVRYNKFLLTARRQADGTWKITHDASLPSTKEAYEAAKPVAGLKYDG